MHDAVYDEFVAQFSVAISRLKVGNGLDHGVTVGPLIDQAAKDKVNGLIARATQQGAHSVVGGQGYEEGLFMEPTLLIDVHQNMDIVRDEIFGPVAPVIRFHNDDELIAMANDTIYGLAAYFYSQNINRIWQWLKLSGRNSWYQ